MGVHGLTSFISGYHEKYKEKIYVRDGPVVIDGSNLMYFLYFEGKSSVVERGPKKLQAHQEKKSLPHAYLFGGDWEQYAQNVRYFFQQLKQCIVTPIVILDGAYDSSKLEVAKLRFAENVMKNVKPASDEAVSTPGKTYTPIFLKTVFLEVLSEQKVVHYQSIGEADPTIAFVAKLLKNCPILSCDSDFYIYISAKVIPLGSLKFAKATPSRKNKPAGENYVQEKIWTLQGERVSLPKLCNQEFKLSNPKLLPLAAVILGNDTVEKSFSTQFLPARAVGKGSLKMNISMVLKWLAEQRSVDTAIRAITESVPSNQQKRMVQLLLANIAIYEGESGETKIWERLKKDTDLSDCIDKEVEEKLNLTKINVLLRSLDIKNCESSENLNLPSWYQEEHISCHFQTYLLNIHKNHVVFLTPQIEMYESASSHHDSIPVIQVTAGILTGNSTIDIQLITHRKGKLFSEKINPVLELQKFGKLPLFEDPQLGYAKEQFSQTLSHERRVDLLMATLNLHDKDKIGFVKAWPSSYRIWMATLAYYFKCKLSSKKLEQCECLAVLASIFLCIIKNLLVNPCSPGKTSCEDNPFETLLKTVYAAIYQDPAKLQKIRKFYQKFEDYSNVTSKKFLKNYDIRLAYSLSEYVGILFHTEMLNNLLGNPMKSPKVRYTLNNFFVYRLAQHIINIVEDNLNDNGVKLDLIADVTGIEEITPLLREFLGWYSIPDC